MSVHTESWLPRYAVALWIGQLPTRYEAVVTNQGFTSITYASRSALVALFAAWLGAGERRRRKGWSQ